MKTKVHFLICLSVLFSVFTQSLFSQVSNDDRFNVFVQAVNYNFEPDFNGSDTNYPRFAMEMDADANSAATCNLVNSDGTGYENFWSWAADTPSQNNAQNGQKVLHYQTNILSRSYDFVYLAWDDNDCGSIYEYNHGCNTGFPLFQPYGDYSGYFVCVLGSAAVPQSNPGSFKQEWVEHESGKVGVEIRKTWRYTSGHRTGPLQFGTLAYLDSLAHTNWNNGPASGAWHALGYHNDWKSSHASAFADERDVTYEFTVLEDSRIIISTDHPETDYNTKIHLVRKIDNTNWDHLTVAQNHIDENIVAGTYYIVVEGDAGNRGKFKLSVKNYDPDYDAGEIAHSRPWIEAACTLTMPISNTIDAYSSNGLTTYSWEKTAAGTNLWESILGATNATLNASELGSLDVDTDIRRVATSYNYPIYSNELSFAVATSKTNGRISGLVRGPGGELMSGVTVYATMDSPNQGQCPNIIKEVMTDPVGRYTLTDLYYGLNSSIDTVPDVSYRVWAEFLDHEITPTEYLVELNTSDFIKNNFDFTDEEVVFIKGRVTQTDLRSEGLSDTCVVPDVQFKLNTFLQTQSSDIHGEYALPVISFGENYVEAIYENHVFSPPVSETYEIFDTQLGVDFDDTTTNTVSGTIRACGNFNFGSVEILFEDEAGCFIFIDTTDNAGSFSIDLPARAYTMQVLSTDLEDLELEDGFDHNEIANYFSSDIFELDVDTSDTELHLQYRQTPEVQITGLTANSCGEYVVEQGQSQMINFLITEPNTFGCPVDTGLIKIVDVISGLENEIIEIPFKDGIAQYEMIPGEPKITGDHNLGFTATVYAIEAEELKTTLSFEAIVVGNNPRDGAPFVTVSPEIPMMILRDPPGDGSYAYLEQNQTSEFAYSFSALAGGSTQTWASAKIGTDISLDGIGFSFNTANWGELTGSSTVGTYNSTQLEAVMSITNGIRFETSADDNPSVMGQGGDIYIGSALNLHYSLTDIVSYNTSTCQVEQSVDVIIGSEAKPETQFRYTDYFIRTSVIPGLEFLINESNDQEEITDYQDQIAMWNQTLQLNKDLKDRATTIDTIANNLSWSGATNTDMYTTESSTERATFEFKMEIESEVAAEAGWEVAGSGQSGGVIVNMRMEIGAGISVSNLLERTTGFVLADNDPDDGFNTKVRMCPTYNTPVFENVAGFTSCPHETGTVPIDFPYLEIDNPVQVGIEPDQAAVFSFELTNLSQNQLTRSYKIDLVTSSDPNSAIIDAGEDFPLEILNVAYNQTFSKLFTVKKNPSSTVFSLEGIQFIAYPYECESDRSELTTSTASVSVYFNSPCSEIALQEPQDGWIHNANAGQSIELHLTDYDVAALNNVEVEYSIAGFNDWGPAVTVLPGELNSNGSVGTFVDWDLTNIEDGEYDIRARVNCDNAINYIERITGTIDRQGPVVFGIPHPVDDHYDPVMNDEIRVSFEEDIVCQNATAVITNLETDQQYTTVVSCADNTAIITPMDVLPSSIFRVSIMDVEDEFQNVREHYEWVFMTGDFVYNPDCSPVAISNNNLDQNAISQSTYQADQIISDGRVAFNTGISFKATESVGLNGGFEVDLGGGFVAEIEECEE